MSKDLKAGTRTSLACPECSEAGRGDFALLIRENRGNGSKFLGCSNYPTCRYTKEIPEEYRMRAMGQKGLFDE